MARLGTVGITSLLVWGLAACGAPGPEVDDGNDPAAQQQTAGGGGSGPAQGAGGAAGASQDGGNGSGGAVAQGGSGGSAPSCNAPAQGTGKNVGDIIAEVSWDAPGNTQLSLHGFCGQAKAVWLVQTAGWCEACKQMAPEYDKVFQKYHDQGLELVLVVGENAAGQAATADYALQYKQSLGYSEGVYAVADPHFSKLDAVIVPAQFLPNDLIVDSQMTIRYLASPNDYVTDSENVIKQLVAEGT